MCFSWSFTKQKNVTPKCVTRYSFSELLPQMRNDNLITNFSDVSGQNKIYDGAGCRPQLEFIQTDRVILSCVHLQNGSCDEPCVTAHPFADSPLVTHQLSHFLSAGLWSPRLKLKISRYNPFLAALGSSFSILLSSLTLQTLLRTVTSVQYYSLYFNYTWRCIIYKDDLTHQTFFFFEHSYLTSLVTHWVYLSSMFL